MRSQLAVAIAILGTATTSRADDCGPQGPRAYLTPSAWMAIGPGESASKDPAPRVVPASSEPDLGVGLRIAFGAELPTCWGGDRRVFRAGLTADVATWTATQFDRDSTRGFGVELEGELVPIPSGAIGVRVGALLGDTFSPLAEGLTEIGTGHAYEVGVRVRLDPIVLGLDAFYSPPASGGFKPTRAEGLVLSIEPSRPHPRLAIVTIAAIVLGVAAGAFYQLDHRND